MGIELKADGVTGASQGAMSCQQGQETRSVVERIAAFAVAEHIELPSDNGCQPDRVMGRGLAPTFDVPIAEQAAEQQTRAIQSLAALGEMTGGIAHDFRNLLAVIESVLRLAEKSSEEPVKVRAYIAAAREGINRGVKLTSQLLTFAKHREFKPQIADANEFLRNLALFLKYGAGPGIRIVLALAPDLPKCLIEPSQFNAAVLNLVMNARDAMPNGGEVRISTARYSARSVNSRSPMPGPYVRVRVEDSGLGMSPEIARRIFDPFFTTKGEKGTGLGLPQVRAFMRRIGGYVTVASQSGVGATFDLLFPVAEHDEIVSFCASNADLRHEPVLRR